MPASSVIILRPASTRILLCPMSNVFFCRSLAHPGPAFLTVHSHALEWDSEPACLQPRPWHSELPRRTQSASAPKCRFRYAIASVRFRPELAPDSKCSISVFASSTKESGYRLTAPTMLRKATHLSAWLHRGLQRFRRALLPCGLHRRVAIPFVPIRVALMATPILSRSRDYGLWAHHTSHCARIPLSQPLTSPNLVGLTALALGESHL